MLATAAASAVTPALASPPSDWAPKLEAHFGGRLGVSVLDTANGHRYGYREHERVIMCSTFKLMLVGAVLSRVDAGKEQLARTLAYGQADLLSNSPVTTAHVGEGALSVETLCAAALGESDNTAANLLLAIVGGPGGLTQRIRETGDHVTRVDRTELALNKPDGDKDTTTPDAMLRSVDRLLLGSGLPPAQQQKMIDWLRAGHRGDKRIKAGVPDNWRVADKPGTGYAACNDVAVLWPSEGRKPIIVTAYYSNAETSFDAHETVLMEVGRAVAANFG